MRNIILTLLLVPVFSALGQTPMEKYEGKILFKGGTLHVGNGDVIDRALIGVENGRITLVKSGLTYTIDKTEYDTVIELSGKHIYPGFINTNNTLGITEIDAVRPTLDFNETGLYNPNVKTGIAFNTESEVVYTVRTNGILYTQCTPRGGYVSGMSSIVSLDGWNWEDAVVKMEDGIHVNWPEKITSSGWWANPGPNVKNKKYDENRDELIQFIKSAKAYCEKKNYDQKNLKFEAFRGVFDGEKRIYFHADFANEINEIIDLSRELKFNFPVIVGGYDSWLLVERLKENKFSVILDRIHGLPEFDEDDVNLRYKLPLKLKEAGVLYCLSMHGDMEAMNSRNLPFQAGTARSFGLSKEDAVQSISLNVAKILGIDKDLGSVEEGKLASFFVSEGDALDMKTNKVILAFMNGRFLNLVNRQQQLYETYSNKYKSE
ncbi:MAG: amidohydrolase family protein [Crocinitomicaceae bacterium]|nr:amidohydrolase family protein [Crocinitomicaceae bacterium]